MKLLITVESCNTFQSSQTSTFVMLSAVLIVVLVGLSVSQTDANNPCLSGEKGKHIHHQKCHQYYDCDVSYDKIPKGLEQNLVECEYPQLYNEEKQVCEEFKDVDCGGRTEYKNGCDYMLNQHKCEDPNKCTPCYLAFPECEQMEDGIHALSYRINYYTECKDGRFMGEKKCTEDDDFEVSLYWGKTVLCSTLY